MPLDDQDPEDDNENAEIRRITGASLLADALHELTLIRKALTTPPKS